MHVDQKHLERDRESNLWAATKHLESDCNKAICLPNKQTLFVQLSRSLAPKGKPMRIPRRFKKKTENSTCHHLQRYVYLPKF